jgi:tetratricopeptide (TPR) repeat protein
MGRDTATAKFSALTDRQARTLWAACLPLTLILWGCGKAVVPVSSPPAARQTTSQSTLPPAIPPSNAPTLSIIQARDILADATAKSPNDPLRHLELALFDMKTGDRAEAERQLREMIRRFPRFPRAPHHLGMLYLTQGRVQEALTPLRIAATLAPEDAQAQANVGQVLLRLGSQEEARKFADRALKADPRLPDTYLLLSRINDRHGTANQAIEYAKKYLELSGNPAPGLFLIGRTYARQADSANAETWLIKARDAAPENPEIWLTLGRVYYEMMKNTRRQEGINCFEKVLELSPRDWEANLWLGRARMDEGRFADAVAHFRLAQANSPQPGPIYYDLGQALIKAGQTEEGQKALATFQSYREYTKGIERLTAEAEKAPRDRSRRYALIRFCMQHRQYRAALSLLNETEQTLGADATLRQLRAELSQRMTEAGLSPSTLSPGGPGNVR